MTMIRELGKSLNKRHGENTEFESGDITTFSIIVVAVLGVDIFGGGISIGRG